MEEGPSQPLFIFYFSLFTADTPFPCTSAPFSSCGFQSGFIAVSTTEEIIYRTKRSYFTVYLLWYWCLLQIVDLKGDFFSNTFCVFFRDFLTRNTQLKFLGELDFFLACFFQASVFGIL